MYARQDFRSQLSLQYLVQRQPTLRIVFLRFNQLVLLGLTLMLPLNHVYQILLALMQHYVMARVPLRDFGVL